jgi:AraC-like DNA-binding protein
MHYIPTETKFTLKLTGGKRYRTVAIFPKHNVILKMQSDYPPLKRLLDAYANKNADLLTLPSTVLSSEDRNELVKTRNGTLSQQARFRYYNNRMNEFLVDYLEGVNRAGDNPDKAERLMEQIHQLILRLEHHPEKSFNIQLLAQQVGISLRYLERFFQEIKQSSVISYIIKLRVEKSKELLVTTNKTVGEISILIGYEDQSYFVRVFKKTTGITPTMYRSAERNKRNDK